MKRLFILDDNDELLDIMNRILSPQYAVTTCSDKRSAMTIISMFMPDLIILDYYMGKNDTEDIIRLLQTLDSSASIPMILFSGYPGIKESAERLGLAGYLEKPSSISKIRSYIKNTFEKTAICG